MKKLLFILPILLIVGCAPPKSNFYIGMDETIFFNNNPSYVELSNNKGHYGQNSNGNTYYENKGKLNEYLFGFTNDTLVTVYRGLYGIPYKEFKIK